MPNALGIGLLGPLQVRDETGRPVHVGGRQLRVLLTLLALNAGRVVPVGSLAGELWPDDPPGNPGNALQTLVSRLRAELRQAGAGGVIESHPAGYRLAVPPDAVDVMTFENLAAQGRRALADGDAAQAARVLRDALLAWRGQPLADAAGSDFAEATAARLTELRSSVLADRIEADLALGEGASLIGELRVLLSADPLAERPRAQLMRALYAAGRQAEAIAAYHEGRELLADQLGVDPSAQLEQVYLGILRGPAASRQRSGAVAKPPARAHDDPERAAVPAQERPSATRARSPLTSFVGRDEDLPRVLKNLRAARLVTLTGPGGVGKTRLAIEASERLGAAAWFVPLAPVADPAEVAYTVLDALGIREPVIARRAAEPGTGPLDRLAAALGDRDQVLILDNCEHVVEAAAALAGHVLAACPRLRILATSRQPLRIDGETLCPVPPLPIPPALAAPVTIASYGSVRLLREQTLRMAEARVVCAMTAAGDSWEIDTVQPALAAAVADLNRWSPDTAPSHPIAAMGEPMLALYDQDPDRAFAVIDRYVTSEDPWVRAAVPLLRATFGSMLGRMDWAESDCQAALAAFRALGEAWGTAAVLVQLSEFARLRGDNAAAVAALEEAGALGKQLGAWGDLSHIGGKLAAVRLRLGDLAGARADLERAEREEAARGIGQSDSATWLGLVRAELLYREGDTAAAGSICAGLLARLEQKQSSWWFGVQAMIQARLALIVLAGGDETRCRALLAAALQTATSWVELPPAAEVIDAIAVLAQRLGEGATAVATLLGAAHAVRGCFDEGSLDTPAVRGAVRAVLGADEFGAAYEHGRSLPRDDALALAASAVANPVTAG